MEKKKNYNGIIIKYEDLIDNIEKEFLTNKVDLKNSKKGFFEKFFNLFG